MYNRIKFISVQKLAHICTNTVQKGEQMAGRAGFSTNEISVKLGITVEEVNNLIKKGKLELRYSRKLKEYFITRESYWRYIGCNEPESIIEVQQFITLYNSIVAPINPCRVIKGFYTVETVWVRMYGMPVVRLNRFTVVRKPALIEWLYGEDTPFLQHPYLYKFLQSIKDQLISGIRALPEPQLIEKRPEKPCWGNNLILAHFALHNILLYSDAMARSIINTRGAKTVSPYNDRKHYMVVGDIEHLRNSKGYRLRLQQLVAENRLNRTQKWCLKHQDLHYIQETLARKRQKGYKTSHPTTQPTTKSSESAANLVERKDRKTVVLLEEERNQCLDEGFLALSLYETEQSTYKLEQWLVDWDEIAQQSTDQGIHNVRILAHRYTEGE